MSPDGNIYWPDAPDDIITGYGGDENGRFIHEMTHVWQDQHGVNVAGRGFVLHAAAYLSMGYYNPYSYSNSPNAAFADCNIEQQANIAVAIYFNVQPNIIP